MRIVVPDDYQGIVLDSAHRARLEKLGEVAIYTEKIAGEADAVERMRGAAIALGIRERTPLSRAVLSALPDLKLLSMTGTGFANLDLRAATELGILVTRTPGGSSRAVAELTFGLMISVLRRIAFGDAAVRRGEWPGIAGSVARWACMLKGYLDPHAPAAIRLIARQTDLHR